MTEFARLVPGYTLPHLVTTDRLLDIWGSDSDDRMGGTLHPLERLRMLREGINLARTISNDDIMVIIDKAVLSSPDRVRAFAFAWYRWRETGGYREPKADQVARRIGVSRAGLYIERRAALESLRATLKAEGLDV